MAKNKLSKDELERMRLANEVLFQEKACPACGSRMAVCRQPESAAEFPYLNLGDREMKNVYYCPACKAYHSVEDAYDLYEPKRRESFAGDGRKYLFTREFVYDRVIRVLVRQGIAAVCVLPLFLYMLRMTVRDFGVLNWAGMLLCGVALFVLVYFAAYYFRLWGVCKRAFFELGAQGVIFCDGVEPAYIPWEDFRLAEAIPGGEEIGDSFVFDTSERSFVINQNLQDYKDAAMRIAKRIRDDVPMNPRLTNMVYSMD